MPKYLGKQVQVRLAAGTAALATAVPIPNIQSIEWNMNENVQHVPKGLGQGRNSEVYDGVQEPSGNIVFWYDGAAIEGGSTLDSFVEATTALGSAEMTKRNLEVRVGTGGTHRLKEALGLWRASAPSVAGFVTQQWDFVFEDHEKL